GLAIARHLVELHGGSIAADSEGPGKGSVFTIAFPAGPAPAEGDRAAAGEASAPPWNEGRALAGVRVLVVEDEADTRELLARMLERCGAAVTAVGSAAEALAALDRMAAANGPRSLPH